MRLTRYSFVILAVVLAVSAFPATAFGQASAAPDATVATTTSSVYPINALAEPNSSTANAAEIATITQMENAAVKADIAGDSSFVEKNYADNFTGGSSWGNWETKQSILTDMKDSKQNKTNSEAISDVSVRVYGDTAIATYKSTYDSLYHGDRRARTILSTDTFVRQNGTWKQVASHSSELAK
jgi:ketosteroid isomerase-like protein